MKDIDGLESGLAHQYEAVFCIFMALLAFLCRDNERLVYPQILHLCGLLLALNFAAGFSLRAWPSRAWISATMILANCATISGIVSYSGGEQSALWVLYLLPIFTACLLLNGRMVAWITLGAVGFNAAYQLSSFESWTPALLFDPALRSGILTLSATLTWSLARAERFSLEKLSKQRERIRSLEEKAQALKAIDEQTQSLAEMGLISAGIVHDLKTPLTVMDGYLQLCVEKKPLDPEVKTDLERILRVLRLSQGMVSSILGATRKEKLALVSCEIHETIESAVEVCREILRKSGISVRREFQTRPLALPGSPQHLQRIFLNLISNAAKAMPRGGALTIKTEVDGPHEGRSWVRIQVQDTGPGITPETVAKLFRPFSTTRPQEGGTGLGLYVCREIALQHGGMLWCDDSVTQGARFVLSLPLPQNKTAASAEKSRALTA